LHRDGGLQFSRKEDAGAVLSPAGTVLMLAVMRDCREQLLLPVLLDVNLLQTKICYSKANRYRTT
jgi:hypothetical protein